MFRKKYTNTKNTVEVRLSKNYITLARKYQYVRTKIIPEKRRQALSLQEYEEIAKAVYEYPCLYDKAKNENKDKIVTENASKEVAA